MPINLTYRSREEELLDQPGIPAADLRRNLDELDTINRWLGGHRATLVGLQKLMTDPSKTYRIIDFGCGGGDTLREIHTWAIRKGLKVHLTGLDFLPHAIEHAKETCAGIPDMEWVCTDFRAFEPEVKYDIAICSLFCHHFYDDSLTELLQKMRSVATHVVVINDLHRHWFAWFGIALLTTLFSRSHLVKNDAKLSVAKGFLRSEWEQFFRQTGISSYRIHWIWAFRHLILLPPHAA